MKKIIIIVLVIATITALFGGVCYYKHENDRTLEVLNFYLKGHLDYMEYQWSIGNDAITRDEYNKDGFEMVWYKDNVTGEKVVYYVTSGTIELIMG